MTALDIIRHAHCIHGCISPKFEAWCRIVKLNVELSEPTFPFHTNIIPLNQKSKQESFNKFRQNSTLLVYHTSIEMSRVFKHKFPHNSTLIIFSQSHNPTSFFYSIFRQYISTRNFDTKFRHHFSTIFFDKNFRQHILTCEIFNKSKLDNIFRHHST